MGDTEETIEDIEGTAEEEAAGAEGVRKKLLGPAMVKTLIYVALALVMIIISGTVAYFIAQRVGTPPAAQKVSPEGVEKARPYWYFNMESFSINTSDIDEPHFVKLTIALGYEEGKVDLQTELNQRRPQLRDIIIRIVGSKKYTDLNTQDKREALKEEIKNSINDVLIQGKIKNVVFTEFVLT